MNMAKENERKWETALDYAKARAIKANATNMLNEGNEPEIGMPLYTYKDCNLWTVSMVHNPYTVIAKKGKRIVIQEARLIFNGVRYFNTLPDRIEADPNGKTKTLRYDSKKNRWVVTPKEYSAEVAVFGRYDYQPYLD